MHLVYPAVLAALLFSTGLYGVLARRNAILVLMSVELMLAAVSLNLVAFDVWLRDTTHAGQVFTLFLIALAAAEIGIGLAIVLLMYRARGTSAIDQMRELRDTDRPHGPTGVGPAATAAPTRASTRTASEPVTEPATDPTTPAASVPAEKRRP
ncbi:NADH-quinone oxidoreductase subunit NuoK [Streptomyces sp. 4N509B]|uniref:NADH-quinone oxidoreductase subunit NuoK n=1 Tax=Streptomyces sp. 4N509B TaxID=3457413 RepID=UPI003FCF6F6F